MANVRKFSENVYVIDSDYAELWVAEKGQVENADYYYGGTRTVPFDSDDKACEERICYLKDYESGLKNVFINDVIALGKLDGIKEEVPAGYLEKIGRAHV